MTSLSNQRRALRAVDRNDFEAVVQQRDDAREIGDRYREALEEIAKDRWTRDAMAEALQNIARAALSRNEAS